MRSKLPNLQGLVKRTEQDTGFTTRVFLATENGRADSSRNLLCNVTNETNFRRTIRNS
jgi:hypothetical protein